MKKLLLLSLLVGLTIGPVQSISAADASHMKKLVLLPLVVGLVAAGVVLATFPENASKKQPLSVAEAITIIWRMNHDDICELHGIIFPKIEDPCYLDKAINAMDRAWKAISEKIFGKTVVTRVLQTYQVVNSKKQELMKKAIEGSYDEYIGFNGVGVFAAIITFPVGLIILYQHAQKHIAKIEAQRAALRKVV